eukprot:scaffold15960_cov63-Phaeocystis_antarctica.AAC.2
MVGCMRWVRRRRASQARGRRSGGASNASAAVAESVGPERAAATGRSRETLRESRAFWPSWAKDVPSIRKVAPLGSSRDRICVSACASGAPLCGSSASSRSARRVKGADMFLSE